MPKPAMHINIYECFPSSDNLGWKKNTIARFKETRWQINENFKNFYSP